jgi:hypothetical protein
MKVVITEKEIRITTKSGDMPVDQSNKVDWSCRLAAIEAMAWAAQKLSEELQKSVEFYRTGKHENQISSID